MMRRKGMDMSQIKTAITVAILIGGLAIMVDQIIVPLFLGDASVCRLLRPLIGQTQNLPFSPFDLNC